MYLSEWNFEQITHNNILRYWKYRFKHTFRLKNQKY